jgi:hypothetical protein
MQANLRPNVIVRGAILPEPVQVLVVVPMGASVKLIGKGLTTGRVHEREAGGNVDERLRFIGAHVPDCVDLVRRGCGPRMRRRRSSPPSHRISGTTDGDLSSI